MIDLHIHTTYSDGTDSVKNILSNVQNIGLEVISITDHNSCLSYIEMDKFDISNLYNGNIIVGCEFTTSFDNRLIEVLGYGFDYIEVQKYLDKYYSKELINYNTSILYKKLLKRIDELGLIYKIESKSEKTFNSEFFEREIYEELIKYPENKEILKENIWDSYSEFFRKGLSNSKSKLFLNHAEFKPRIEEIINLVHSNGGLVFLAHPYQYKFDDTESFLEDIYNKNNLDGIECFYTTFSESQSNYLLYFARKRNLLISGGSDYHGDNKKNHDLGAGRGNLHIKKKVLENWDIKYYK